MVRFWVEEKTFLIEKAYDDGGDEVGGENDDEPGESTDKKKTNILFKKRYITL